MKRNILILPQIYLHDLSVFDVGNNPSHINHGLIKSGLVRWVSDHIKKLSSASHITISGYALELLDEEAPELIASMKEIIENQHIEVIGIPYYNTSLSLLTLETFNAQWEKNQQTIKKYLGVKARSIYVGKQQIPSLLNDSFTQKKLLVIGKNSLDIIQEYLGSSLDSSLESSSCSSLENTTDGVGVGVDANSTISPHIHIGDHSPYHEKEIHTPMAQHVRDELKAIEPFAIKDKEISSTWQLLANTQLLESLEGEEPQTTYNNYSSMMNILNDITHTIRNVELIKSGEFETTAQIVENPSTKIFDALESSLKNEVVR